MGETSGIAALRAAAAAGKIQWRRHCLERMLEREITRERVTLAILHGEVIESYPGDRPYPSVLLLHIQREPLHVVAAYDPGSGICHVITAYRPGLDRFEDDLKTRRQ